MTRKSKYQPGDIIYYKYPSRYSPTYDKNTIEAILYVAASPDTGSIGHDIYLIKLLKNVRGNFTATVQIDVNEYLVDTTTLETYSRHLTPTEQVLYGKRV